MCKELFTNLVAKYGPEPAHFVDDGNFSKSVFKEMRGNQAAFARADSSFPAAEVTPAPVKMRSLKSIRAQAKASAAALAAAKLQENPEQLQAPDSTKIDPSPISNVSLEVTNSLTQPNQSSAVMFLSSTNLEYFPEPVETSKPLDEGRLTLTTSTSLTAVPFSELHLMLTPEFTSESEVLEDISSTSKQSSLKVAASSESVDVAPVTKLTNAVDIIDPSLLESTVSHGTFERESRVIESETPRIFTEYTSNLEETIIESGNQPYMAVEVASTTQQPHSFSVATPSRTQPTEDLRSSSTSVVLPLASPVSSSLSEQHNLTSLSSDKQPIEKQLISELDYSSSTVRLVVLFIFEEIVFINYLSCEGELSRCCG
jgi:hypothetical protein